MGQHGQQGAERNQWLLQTFIRQAQRLLSITEGERPQLEHFADRHTSDLRSVNVSVCLREDSRPQDCGGVENLTCVYGGSRKDVLIGWVHRGHRQQVPVLLNADPSDLSPPDGAPKRRAGGGPYVAPCMEIKVQFSGLHITMWSHFKVTSSHAGTGFLLVFTL